MHLNWFVSKSEGFDDYKLWEANIGTKRGAHLSKGQNSISCGN